ncbi:hypothetical protein HYE82_28335 [Streptomyces sp. BR123]|uniref:hypothetical protein n=1 Tax=Streptomyces sp. BR123 TaxID=2749828 RepID=UPI0015C4C299|nr:hypothetical protein [Streptomyces sp. BR123]NXY98210.1 hypothetical protein [Streptomyces sp. BR123]
MSDQLRSWRWDREDRAANRQALEVHRHGHVIRCDHRGLLIDGERIDTTPVYMPVPVPKGEPEPVAFELGDDGRLFYRGQLKAVLAPPAPGTYGPGPIDLHPGQTPSPRPQSSGRSTAA